MNKTLKTIAWICLSLGVLGMIVDAGVLFLGSRYAAERRSAFENIQTAVETGDLPAFGSRCIAEDADNDGKPDGDCLNLPQPNKPGFRSPGEGSRLGQISRMPALRSRTIGKSGFRLMILPIFFFAFGPILAVVGAVILLVNREPKMKDAEVKKE